MRSKFQDRSKTGDQKPKYSPPLLVKHGPFSRLTAAGSGLRVEGTNGSGMGGNPNRRP